MARVAGHLKPTIKIKTRAMGINAINADKLRDKPLLLFIGKNLIPGCRINTIALLLMPVPGG